MQSNLHQNIPSNQLEKNFIRNKLNKLFPNFEYSPPKTSHQVVQNSCGVCSKYQQEIKTLKQQIQHLKQAKIEYDMKVDSLQRKSKKLEQQNIHFETQISTNVSIIMELRRQLKLTQTQLDNELKEVSNQKYMLSSLRTQISQLQNYQTRHLVPEIQQMLTYNKQLKGKLKDTENNMIELQEKVIQLTQELGKYKCSQVQETKKSEIQISQFQLCQQPTEKQIYRPQLTNQSTGYAEKHSQLQIVAGTEPIIQLQNSKSQTKASEFRASVSDYFQFSKETALKKQNFQAFLSKLETVEPFFNLVEKLKRKQLALFEKLKEATQKIQILEKQNVSLKKMTNLHQEQFRFLRDKIQIINQTQFLM